MYRISRTTDGGLVGYTDDLRLIRRKFGLYVTATPHTATGVSYHSTPYNLEGTEGVGASETVRVTTVETCEIANTTDKLTARQIKDRADIDYIAMEAGVDLDVDEED